MNCLQNNAKLFFCIVLKIIPPQAITKNVIATIRPPHFILTSLLKKILKSSKV